MRGVWFEEYERLWNEADDGEPSADSVNEAVIERMAAAADRARDAAKYAEFD